MSTLKAGNPPFFWSSLCRIEITFLRVVLLVSFGATPNARRLLIWPGLRCVVAGVCNVPCYHPQAAFRTPSTGSVVFVGPGQISNLTLPCGQCLGCRLERSRQWAVRCMHEAKMHPYSSFVTLTYSEENLPFRSSLSLRDHQLFMKRLRKSHNVRFYSCGEYGPENGRPHFHLCIFGYHFPDRVPFGRGFYRSAELEGLWTLGNSSVSDLTFERAAYAARYVCDKINGDKAKPHYERVDQETGEIYSLRPEFNLMSRRPGIGSSFYDKFHSEMYPSDTVIVNGRTAKPPRYYDKKFEKYDPESFDLVKIQRELDAELRHLDNTPARLAVKKQIAIANFTKRSKVFS